MINSWLCNLITEIEASLGISVYNIDIPDGAYVLISFFKWTLPFLIFQLSVCFLTCKIKNRIIKTTLRLIPTVINVADMLFSLLIMYENPYIIRMLKFMGAKTGDFIGFLDIIFGWDFVGESCFFMTILAAIGVLMAFGIYRLCYFIPQRISRIKKLRSR